MKERFISRIAEAGRVIWEIRLAGLAMNTLICFLAFSVMLTIFDVNVLYGLAPTAVYALSAFFRSMIKSNVIETIEKRNQGLEEKLRTAYDNRDRGNLVVEDLLSGVSNEMENVETSSFLDSRRLTTKVAASIALVFLMLAITAMDFRGMASNLIDINGLMRGVGEAMRERGIEYESLAGGPDRWEGSNLTTEKEEEKYGTETGGERPGFNIGPNLGAGGGVGTEDSSDIYGQASSAAIEGQNVDLNLRPDYGGEIEIKEEGDEQANSATGLEGAEAAETCDECAVGPEHEELVKRYFEKILGETR